MMDREPVNVTALQVCTMRFEAMLTDARAVMREESFDVLVRVLTARVARLNFERLPIIERGEIEWPS